MFRDLLSSRLIQAGLLFFVIVVGGSLLYSGHIKRATKKEMAGHDRFLQGLEKPNETRPSETVNGATEIKLLDLVNTPEAATDPPMPESTQVSSNEIEFVDILLDDVVLEEVAPEIDVPVSPFGFGPYPEVPADYPLAASLPWFWSEEKKAQSEAVVREGLKERGMTFEDYLKEYELIGRVGIKLWNDGRRFNGITTMDQTGRYYPDEPDVLYVGWRETTLPNGEVRRYMGNTIGSALQNVPIAAIEGREPPPDWIEIRSLDEGIDPYEYLGLSR